MNKSVIFFQHFLKDFNPLIQIKYKISINFYCLFIANRKRSERIKAMKTDLLKKGLSTLAVALCCTGYSTFAQAADLTETQDADPWTGIQWLIRGRAITVMPDVDNARIGGAPAPLDVDNSVVPELDITYFFNDNIAAELILAVTPHDVSIDGVGKVSDALLLPPTLTLQYHRSYGNFKPYLGVGLNYTRIIDSDPTALIGNAIDFDDSFGFALQAGFDVAIDDKWSWNVDVKKIFLDIDAKVGPAATPVSLELDPWIVGTGIGYRF